MAARRKKPAAGSVGLTAAELTSGKPSRAIEEVAERVAAAGGEVLARYRDPLGGHWLVLAVLPLSEVEATPYQRELSDAHVKQLCAAMPRVGRFLDPIVAVPADAGFWTPNGMHRLAAMRALGAKAITALVVPERELALRILALNTEKAHNLRDKSLEVVRMERALAAAPDVARKPESDWQFEFEEPAYLTIGLCYEARPRFAGGAYLPVVKRCEAFLDEPIRAALAVREARARQVLALDDVVAECVERLREAGFRSPYLKPFVVARVNPLRFVKAARVGEKAPRAEFEATLQKMIASAKGLDVAKIRPQDLAQMGAAMGEEAPF